MRQRGDMRIRQLFGGSQRPAGNVDGRRAQLALDDGGDEHSGAIFRSSSMEALLREVEPIARSDINVLILGETGVGKDVLANRIHAQSERRSKPFCRINCAALPEALLESELFGFERGAFTGALTAKRGLFEAAEGGTVFLDEMGEFPLHLQSKLLLVIETKQILGLGSTRAKNIDVRFLAATNRDLEAEALAGRFRRDLYYRLAGYTALVPPLRERPDDILPLAYEFLRRLGETSSVAHSTLISEQAAVRLRSYAWPGNVRELRNVVERASVLSGGRAIGVEHLPFERRRPCESGFRPAARAQEGPSGVNTPRFELSGRELEERKAIVGALAKVAGNQVRAAALLGMSRSTLLNRLDAYRIRRPRKRPE
jgi:two-component system, NtrC family, response regulator AtoC